MAFAREMIKIKDYKEKEVNICAGDQRRAII